MRRPAAVTARDAVLLRWIRKFHSPWYRDVAIEGLSRPDADLDALGEAFAWCVHAYPDPGNACVGFAEHLLRIGVAGPRMLADAAQKGDGLVAYYAARFLCWHIKYLPTPSTKDAVRDALVAAQSHGYRNGHFAACIEKLAKMIPDLDLDPTPRAPCATAEKPGE